LTPRVFDRWWEPPPEGLEDTEKQQGGTPRAGDRNPSRSLPRNPIAPAVTRGRPFPVYDAPTQGPSERPVLEFITPNPRRLDHLLVNANPVPTEVPPSPPSPDYWWRAFDRPADHRDYYVKDYRPQPRRNQRPRSPRRRPDWWRNSPAANPADEPFQDRLRPPAIAHPYTNPGTWASSTSAPSFPVPTTALDPAGFLTHGEGPRPPDIHGAVLQGAGKGGESAHTASRAQRSLSWHPGTAPTLQPNPWPAAGPTGWTPLGPNQVEESCAAPRIQRSLSWHPGTGPTLQQNPWPAAAGWTAAAPLQEFPQWDESMNAAAQIQRSLSWHPGTGPTLPPIPRPPAPGWMAAPPPPGAGQMAESVYADPRNQRVLSWHSGIGTGTGPKPQPAPCSPAGWMTAAPAQMDESVYAAARNQRSLSWHPGTGPAPAPAPPQPNPWPAAAGWTAAAPPPGWAPPPSFCPPLPSPYGTTDTPTVTSVVHYPPFSTYSLLDPSGVQQTTQPRFIPPMVASSPAVAPTPHSDGRMFRTLSDFHGSLAPTRSRSLSAPTHVAGFGCGPLSTSFF